MLEEEIEALETISILAASTYGLSFSSRPAVTKMSRNCWFEESHSPHRSCGEKHRNEWINFIYRFKGLIIIHLTCKKNSHTHVKFQFGIFN